MLFHCFRVPQIAFSHIKIQNFLGQLAPRPLQKTRTLQHLNLCSLDVLGLEDRLESGQGSVYQEFKKQFTTRRDGRHKTSLPWKAHHPELPTNYYVAKRIFQSFFNWLDKQSKPLKTYHGILEDKLKDGVAPDKLQGSRQHYIPHKPR